MICIQPSRPDYMAISSPALLPTQNSYDTAPIANDSQASDIFQLTFAADHKSAAGQGKMLSRKASDCQLIPSPELALPQVEGKLSCEAAVQPQTEFLVIDKNILLKKFGRFGLSLLLPLLNRKVSS
jgi:hypothetical protein